MKFLVIPLMLLASMFSFAGTEHNHDQVSKGNEAVNYTNTLLILGDNHMSVAKMEMLQDFAKDKALKLEYKRFKDVSAKQASIEFSKHELVIFDVLSARLASMRTIRK